MYLGVYSNILVPEIHMPRNVCQVSRNYKPVNIVAGIEKSIAGSILFC